MLTFMVVPLIAFSMIYLFAERLMYGSFNDPKFEDNKRDNNFRQKRKVYFSFVLSTLITIMFCYNLKVVLMI